MISWMQKHKKWLIVTIWISTLAFIGAGFVGWGSYNYGSKASAVAKVGDIEISIAEYQKAYSNVYNQFAQLFGGNFDQEKAKALGIPRQALLQLINQALILNLAKEYDIAVSDEELSQKIISLPYFQTNGKFDKKLYKELLAKNNISIKEFEEGIRKDLTIAKVKALLPVKALPIEADILATKLNIADKIKYKLLSAKNISVDINETKLKQFWETTKDQFTTLPTYTVAYVIQEKLTHTYDETTMQQYYQENKTHFRDSQGKILPFEKAKNLITNELNAKDTKKAALKKYIAFKKGEIKTTKEATISSAINPFTPEILTKVANANLAKPYLKPIPFKDGYIVIKLIKNTPSTVKTFKEAKAEVTPLYIQEEKKKQLLALAQQQVKNFDGKISDFITYNSTLSLGDLPPKAGSYFVKKLFLQEKKNGYIMLDDENVVLFDILEQKLLTKSYNNTLAEMQKVKQTMFDRNFIKVLQNKYDIEIYKGL